MKKILITLLPLLLIGCADPFRETIAAFKKSEHMEKLTKCAGLTGKFEFKPLGQGDRNRYPAYSKEETPMLKITLEKEINGKKEPIHFFFAYNKQTFLFAAKGYATDNENLKYDDFCSNKITSNSGNTSGSIEPKTTGINPSTENNAVATSCWQMNSPLREIDPNRQAWSSLGKCKAEFDKGKSGVIKIETEKPPLVVSEKPYPNWNGAAVKPGLSPTDEWMHCLWYNNNQAICAVVPD